MLFTFFWRVPSQAFIRNLKNDGHRKESPLPGYHVLFPSYVHPPEPHSASLSSCKSVQILPSEEVKESTAQTRIQY